MPTDIKLNTSSHDIDLSQGSILLHDSNTEVVAQRVKIALLTKQGEWFVNLLEGIPYYTEFFRNKNNKSYIDQYMINYINNIQDVTTIQDYTSTIGNDRVLRISVTIITDDGDITSVSLEV